MPSKSNRSRESAGHFAPANHILLLAITGLAALLTGCLGVGGPPNTLVVQPGMPKPRIYKAVLFSMREREFGTFHFFNEVDRKGLERAGTRYFADANVQLVGLARAELLPLPSAVIQSTHGCNAFYVDPDSSEYYCFYSDMLAYYTISARAQILGNGSVADSFSTAVFVVSPYGDGGTRGHTESLGANVPYNGPQSNGCFVFKDQVDRLLTAYGKLPLSSDYYDSTRYVDALKRVNAAVIAHELGHSIGLRHARWSLGEDEDPGSSATWSNLEHRVYGGHGRCVMMDSLPYYYMTDRDSLYFCSPLDGYFNSGTDCVARLGWILPAVP